jgi:nitrogen fixation protein FixH
MRTRSDTRARRRSLIPLLFPAAMLPVLAANGALIYFALQSKPALVSERPFEEGRTYNRELQAAAAQDRLGWSARLDAPLRAGTAGSVALDVTGRDGAPLTGLMVELRVWRPVGALPEQRLRLAETVSGRYTASIALPQAGQWQFDFVARRGTDEFVDARRVVIQ